MFNIELSSNIHIGLFIVCILKIPVKPRSYVDKFMLKGLSLKYWELLIKNLICNIALDCEEVAENIILFG
jgi:hypothetical protein